MSRRLDATRVRAKAWEVRGWLAPYCRRIEIAGSVRRGLEKVKDVELVAIPITETVPDSSSLFSETTVERNLLFEQLDELDRQRLSFRRGKRWGTRFRQFVVDGVPFDLFVVGEETWGAQFAIRTGPWEFVKALVTRRGLGGFLPEHLQQHDGRLWDTENQEALPTPEEEDWFRAIGVPCWEPAKRSTTRLQRWAKAQAKSEGGRRNSESEGGRS